MNENFLHFKHSSSNKWNNIIDFNITHSNPSIYFRKSCNRDGTRTMVHMPINRKAVAPIAHTCPCNKDTSRTSTYRSFPLLPALHFFPFSARFRDCSKEPSKSVARPVLTARNSVRRNGQLSMRATRDDLIVFLSSNTPVWSFCHMHRFSSLCPL